MILQLCKILFFTFFSKNQSETPWKREDDSQERNDKARRAYEALMTVTLRKPDSDEYKKFSEQVKHRAQQQYGNFTYGEEEVSNVLFRVPTVMESHGKIRGHGKS